MVSAGTMRGSGTARSLLAYARRFAVPPFRLDAVVKRKLRQAADTPQRAEFRRGASEPSALRRNVGIARPHARQPRIAGCPGTIDDSLDAGEDRALKRSRRDYFSPTPVLVFRVGRVVLVRDRLPDPLEDRAGNQSADHPRKGAERDIEQLEDPCHRLPSTRHPGLKTG